MKKGKHFRRRKRKGKERKHFGRRNGKERRGKETFYREEGRKENKKGRKKLAGGLTAMRWVMENSLSTILGPSLSGYHWWNSLQSLGEWVRSHADIHEVSSSVPS